MSADVIGKHRSHIPSKASKARGWSRVPSPTVRAETYSLGEEVGVNYMNGNYVSWVDCGNTDSFTMTGTTYTDTSSWTPNVTWYENWQNDGDVKIGVTPDRHEIEEMKEKIKELEVKKMAEKRTLFRVFVIDPRKGGKVLMDGKLVIAENENQAMLKAGVSEVAAAIERELEQVDVFVEEIATFIRPRKETQRVKITKNEEDD